MQHTIEIMVMSGVKDGEVYHFDPRKTREIKIGRDETCDILLDSDAAVSRHHATLSWSEGAWWLKDEGSKNGTHIEHYSTLQRDVRLRGMVQLDAGQLFRVGKTWMRFQPYAWKADADV